MWHKFGRLRRFGGLRYIVLYILRESPKNGAEIMTETERSSMGFWRPSPGSIYPLLNSLAEEDLVKKRDDGRYELTQKGVAELDNLGFDMGHRRLSVSGALDEVDNYLNYLNDLPDTDLSPYRQKINDLAQKTTNLSGRVKNTSTS